MWRNGHQARHKSLRCEVVSPICAHQAVSTIQPSHQHQICLIQILIAAFGYPMHLLLVRLFSRGSSGYVSQPGGIPELQSAQNDHNEFRVGLPDLLINLAAGLTHEVDLSPMIYRMPSRPPPSITKSAS